MTALRYVVAHEDRTHFIGERGLFDGDLEQRTFRRIHRGVSQFVEVHFAQSLQTLEIVLVIRILLEELRLGEIVA